MRILHSGTLDVRFGGPAMSTYLTLLGLRGLGVEAEMVMYRMTRGGQLRGEQVPVHFCRRPLVPKIQYSPTLKREIRALGPYDVYHAQGIWQYHTYAMADVARAGRRPYLISPRGMLYPQDIAKANTRMKRLSLRLRLMHDLNRAALVHATCTDEMMHCRQLGITAPIGIVPNPVEIIDYPQTKTDQTFRLGYLGRVSRRKNIHGLIEAYISLGEEAKGTELLIIGGGDEQYMDELRTMAGEVRWGTVRFLGFLSGREKDEAIASLSVLAMPSEFENLGNVILEGLVRRIPCIATKGAPWSELQTRQCGWWVDYEQEAINRAVHEALHTPMEELQAMGERGRRLMEECYSVEAVATKMKRIYEWVLHREEQPEFVYTLNNLNGGG